MAENQYFTCVGTRHGAPARKATKADWIAARSSDRLQQLCRQIQASTDDDTTKTLKGELPVWTPRCAAFRNDHRGQDDALQPLNRLMLDIDEKGHTDEIMQKCRPCGDQLYLDCAGYITLRVLLIEDSIRHGTHVLVEMPDGLTPNEIQQLVSEKIGYACDPAVKNVAGCIYQVPMSYTRFVDETMYKVTTDGPSDDNASDENASLSFRTEGRNLPIPDGNTNDTTTSQDKILHCVQDDKSGNDKSANDNPSDVIQSEAKNLPIPDGQIPDGQQSVDYQGIPYSLIIQKYLDMYEHGKEPCRGNRNVKTFELASALGCICDYDLALMQKVIPRYADLPVDEYVQTLKNAIKEKAKGMPLRTRKVLEALEKEQVMKATGGTAEEPPKLPKKLPAVLQLLSSKVEPHERATVCNAMFPALATHISGVKFRYTDNVLHEPKFMHITMAPFSTGKSCIKMPVNALIESIRERDQPSRQKEAEYKRLNPDKKKKRDPRPTDILIQIITDNLTDACFGQRVIDADANGQHYLYTIVDEIDQLKNITSSASIDDLCLLIRKAFDNSIHGQERVGADSVCGYAPLRLNFNASCTIFTGKQMLKKNIADGTLSRLNISTLRQDNPHHQPKYGDYDEAFTAALEPYIQKLESAKGIIYCPECNRLLERIIQENHDIADECGNEAFRMFSYRANLIGFLKGMVLYILNDCQWSTEIADFVRFSIQDDLWNKMRFFGQEMEQMILQEEGMLSKMPRNLYEMMPDVFTEDEFKSAHKRMGLNGDAKALMRKWMSRKMVQYDEIGRVYSKTDEWEKKGKKQTKRKKK